MARRLPKLPFQSSKTISCWWQHVEWKVRSGPWTLIHMHKCNRLGQYMPKLEYYVWNIVCEEPSYGLYTKHSYRLKATLYNIRPNANHVTRAMCYGVYLSCLCPMRKRHISEIWDGQHYDVVDLPLYCNMFSKIEITSCKVIQGFLVIR